MIPIAAACLLLSILSAWIAIDLRRTTLARQRLDTLLSHADARCVHLERIWRGAP